MNRFKLLGSLALLTCPLSPAEAQEIDTLPIPSLCTPAPPPPAPKALRDGAHIVLRSDFSGPAAPRTPYLPVAVLSRLLELQAREAEAALRVIPGERPLLVAGDSAAIEEARKAVQELEAIGRRLEVRLEVLLRPGSLPDPLPSLSGPSSPGSTTWRTTLRSGEEAFFGTRERYPFLSTFDVEVSADAGAADPIEGHAYLGKTLHLRASRIHAGEKIHLSGVLDLAELRSTTEFDPQNLELGKLEQPEVASTTVQFADVIHSGEMSYVQLRGLPLAEPDWVLVIRAETNAETRPTSEVDAKGWALLDLAFLSSDSSELPQSAFAEDWEGPETALPRAFPAWNAGAVQGLLEAAAPGSLRGGSGGRTPLTLGKGLILIQRDAPETWRAAQQLLDAAEKARSRAGRLTLRSGELTIDTPWTADDPLRIQCGVERTHVAGYTIEIAPETWMPVPQVEVHFEGLQLDAGTAGADTMLCQVHRRGMSELDREAGPEITNLGAVQWPRRSMTAARVLARIGAGPLAVFERELGAGEQVVDVSVRERD